MSLKPSNALWDLLDMWENHICYRDSEREDFLKKEKKLNKNNAEEE